MAKPSDDFEALVNAERQKLALDQERRRIEQDRATRDADTRAAAQVAATRRVTASAKDLEALARQVAQRLNTGLDKSGTCFYFRISSPHEGEPGTAGIIPRTRGWRGSVYSTDVKYLALSTSGRLLWARGYGSRSGFWAWADLSKLEVGAHEEIRRGLARLVATHGAS